MLFGASVACGLGKPTQFGAGGTGGAGGSDAASDCGSRYAAFMRAYQAAVACNACMNADPCVGGPLIHDACGCKVAAAGADLGSAAESAYQAWTQQGCGPVVCDTACSTSTTFGCGPTSDASSCQTICTPR